MNNAETIITIVIAMIVVLPVVELFLYLPMVSKLRCLNATVKKSIGVISSRRISDHWKEKAVQHYAFQIMQLSLLLLFYLLLLLILFVTVFVGLSLLTGSSFSAAVEKMIFVKVQLAALIAAVSYGVVRKRMRRGV